MQPLGNEESVFDIPLITIAMTAGLIVAMSFPLLLMGTVDDLLFHPALIMYASIAAVLLGGWGTAAAVRDRRRFRSRVAAAGWIGVNLLPVLLGFVPIGSIVVQLLIWVS